MSRFASPIAPGQLQTPNPATSDAVRGAGQFAQANMDRMEGARQANMANSTQRAGMSQQADLARSRMQFEGAQAGMQRQHEAGLQSREMDERMRLEADRQRFEAEQADEDRRFRMELEAKAMSRQKELMALEHKASLMKLEERRAYRGEIAKARDDLMREQTLLSSVSLEHEKGKERLSRARHRLVAHLRGQLTQSQKYEAGAVNAAKAALEQGLLEVSDFKSVGLEANTTNWMESIGQAIGGAATGFVSGQYGIPDVGRTSVNRQLGLLDDAGGVTGIGSHVDLSGDMTAAEGRMRRVMVENLMKGIKVSGLAPQAADEEVVDTVLQILNSAQTIRNGLASGVQPDPDQIHSLLRKVGDKVPDIVVYKALESLSDEAEAQLVRTTALLREASAAEGAVPSVATARLAVQVRALEQIAGLDMVLAPALRGRIPSSETTARLLQELEGRVTAGDLTAEELGSLPSTIQGPESESIRALLESGIFDEVMAEASSVRNLAQREGDIRMGLPGRELGTEIAFSEAEADAETRALRRLIEEFGRDD